MEAVYKMLIGPVNPQKPVESLCLQLWLLKRMGLFPPETENKSVKLLYEVWSAFNRGFFMYIYTTTQMLFFLNVTDLSAAAEGFFFLLTQISLIYKIEMFHRNRYRIQALVKTLNSSLFIPRNEEEEKAVKEAMVQSFIFGLSFLALAHICISSWILSSFMGEEIKLPIAAWFPETWLNNPFGFFFIYVYQVFGVSMSACYNVSTDTLASAMIAHTNGQVKRLGTQWTKIGNEDEESSEIIKAHSDPDEREEQMNMASQEDFVKTRKQKLRGEVTQCVVFHEEILRFVKEVQDIFKGPIFAQIIFSCLIICMTCFIIANETNNLTKTISLFSYLATMLNQILLFCWSGNELIYSSHKLTEKAYFSNFREFDIPTTKALLMFMQRTVRNVTVKAGGIFEIDLSLHTFMMIIKSSYSYLALLQRMHENTLQ